MCPNLVERQAYTLGENVTLGTSGEAVDEQGVAQALTEAGFGGQLSRFEEGTSQLLGKEFGGTGLSGGQWQKVAIARALYRKADLLVLDEPTAALDPRSEHELYEHFASMTKGRTVLLVTHRLASVRMAHRVLVLKNGELVEDGTHDALLARQGEYAELWRMQAQRYGAEVAAS